MAIEKENIEIIDALLNSKNIDVNIKLVFILRVHFYIVFYCNCFNHAHISVDYL